MPKLPLLTMPSSRLQPSLRVYWKYRSASSMRCVEMLASAAASVASLRPKGSSSNDRAMTRRSIVGSREIMERAFGSRARIVEGGRLSQILVQQARVADLRRAGLQLQGPFVELVARRAADLRRDGHRLFERQHGEQRQEQRVMRVFALGSAIEGLAVQHDHELTANSIRIGAEPGRQVMRRHRRHGLELFRQLPAKTERPDRTGQRQGIRQRFDAMRRFEENLSGRRPGAALVAAVREAG